MLYGLSVDHFADLPQLAEVGRSFRHLQRREDRDLAVGIDRGEVPNFEGELGFVDFFVGGEVVGVDGDCAVELVGDEGPGAGHNGGAGVDTPGYPAVGIGRRGGEGDGEGAVGGVVGVVEGGSEGREVGTVGIGAVFWKLLGGTGEGMDW